MPSILIADEETAERQQLCDLLVRAGHTLTLARDGEEALGSWRAQRHALAIMQTALGRTSGMEVAARMKAETPHVYAPVLLLARDGEAARIEALAVADDVVSRPYLPAEVHARAEALLRTRRLIEDLRAQVSESEARSIADSVTGLRNRAFLGERLGEEFRRALRYNEPLSIILVGVDGLSELERERGQAFSDRVLKVVAQALKRSLRQIDVVTRYGPAELAALLPNTHFAGSLTCAERIHREVAKSPVDELSPVVSMGIAFYPGRDVTDPAGLLGTVSRALERAREEGPGSICLYQHQGYLFQPR